MQRTGWLNCWGMRMSNANVRSVLDGRLKLRSMLEDVSVLRTALQIKKGDRVLSICSAGDNSFALGLDGAFLKCCALICRNRRLLWRIKVAGIQELEQSGLFTYWD